MFVLLNKTPSNYYVWVEWKLYNWYGMNLYFIKYNLKCQFNRQTNYTIFEDSWNAVAQQYNKIKTIPQQTP